MGSIRGGGRADNEEPIPYRPLLPTDVNQDNLELQVIKETSKPTRISFQEKFRVGVNIFFYSYFYT